MSVAVRTRVYWLWLGNWAGVQASLDIYWAGKLAGRAGTSWFGLAARAWLESPAIGVIAAARMGPVPRADIVRGGFFCCRSI